MLTVGKLREAIRDMDDSAPVYVALSGSGESWTTICEAYENPVLGIEGWEGCEIQPEPDNLTISTQRAALTLQDVLDALGQLMSKKKSWTPTDAYSSGVRSGMEQAIAAIENLLD